jgi:chloramphenicol 3-O-phosphotransferase
MLGGAPGVGKTTVARRILDLVQAGQQLVQWVDVDGLWQHQPWRVDERMTTMVQANLRAVAEHAATAEVDILVITWVFQSAEMHRLVAGLLPPGTPSISVQLHASRKTWHQRFESDPERPGLNDFYTSRYAQAQTTVVDHVVDTDGLTPIEVARRVAEVTGVLQPDLL